jgi:hypothetical protein
VGPTTDSPLCLNHALTPGLRYQGAGKAIFIHRRWFEPVVETDSTRTSKLHPSFNTVERRGSELTFSPS